MRTVEDYLRLMGHTLPEQWGQDRMGAHERFVLEHGQHWPNHMPYAEVLETFPGHGSPKNCFEDAAMLSQEHPELTYVEGYALNTVLPTPHAWCVTEDGTVVDATWAAVSRMHDTNESSRDYYGFTVTRQHLAAWLVRTGTFGILCDDKPTELLLTHGMDVLENAAKYLPKFAKFS